MQNLIGKQIAQYEIIELLGEGGMGIVYKARDTRLDRIVALKFLSSALNINNEAHAAFEQEAKTTATLNHPNIVTIFEIGSYQDTVFIAMEFVKGRSLRDWINELSVDSLPSKPKEYPLVLLNQCLSILMQVCDALDAAHQAGIIHRDIKPSNILISEGRKIKLVDFGLAISKIHSDGFSSDSSSGTIEYLAPEQAKSGSVDIRTDIWAIGILFYEMLCGRSPFRGEYDQAMLFSILNEEPVPIKMICPEIPGSFIRIIDKCLQKEPNKRYQNVTELKQALLSIQEQQITSKPDDRIRSRWHSKLSKVFIPGTIVILILVIVFVVVLERSYSSLPNEKHLAVLPIKPIGLEEQDWLFCDGLAEALSSKLTQLEKFQGTLWVVPFNEVFYRGINTPNEARSEFGVNLAITGSLQRLNEKIILTLNLVDTENLRQINSIVIEDKLSESFNLQKELIFKMVEILDLEIQSSRLQFLSAGFTSVKGAYEYYLLGNGFLQRSDQLDNLNSAILNYKKSLEVDPHFVEAISRLAESYLAKYKITKEPQLFNLAVNTCNESIAQAEKKSIKYPEVYITMGLIQQQKGNYQEAKKSFLQAIEIDGSNDKAMRELAMCYQQLSETSRAEEMLKKAIQLKPGYWANYNKLGVFYYLQTKYAEAAEQFRQVVRNTPDNIQGYNNLGGIYVLLENNTQAIQQFERSLSIKPNDLAYRNLGTLYFYQGQFQKAADAYKKVLEFTTDDYRIWGGIAESFYWSGADSAETRIQYRQAVTLALKELRVNSQDSEVLIDLSGYYAKLDMQDSSRYYLNQILSQGSKDVEVMFRIATIFEHWGARKVALDWIKKALESGFSKLQIEAYPGLKKLRADARYKILLDKVTSG